MLTVAVVFFKESETSILQSCAFDKLSFLRSEDESEPYRIRVPCLTTKEVRHLNEQLPFLGGTAKLQGAGIPEKDLRAYSEVYRYFPNFHEIVWS
jgi:hypothetical protein